MSNRASKYTVITKQVEYYSDFLNNFDKNPLTGFLARLTNEESVKQSLRNLIMTNRSERFYDSGIGSKLQSLLFEPLDQVTESLLRQEIMTTIENHEPRAQIREVYVTGNVQLDGYFIDVVFSLVNIPGEEFNLTLTVKRIR